MRKLIIAITILGLVFSSLSVSHSQVPQIPINAVIYPIYKPDFDSPGGCSTSSVTVARNDSKDFAQYDEIQVGLYAKEMTLGVPIASGKETIVQDIYTNLPRNRVSIPITLCMRNITGQYVKGEITEVELRVIYKKDFSIEVGRFSTMVKLLNKTPEAEAIEKLEEECDFSSKEPWLAVIQQEKANVAKGKQVTLSGTFFRFGIPAPGDTLRIYQDFNTDPKRGDVKLLSTSTTDKDGVFRFQFVPKSKSGIYSVTFQARTSPIGPLHGPFPSGNFRVFVDCKSTCNYTTVGSITDWIQKHSPTCLAAYEEYDLSFASGTDASLMYANSDDRIPYLFRKVFVGSKGKKAYFNESQADSGGYSSSSGGSGSGKGRCYVSGYTTKTGKRVSGYWRSC